MEKLHRSQLLEDGVLQQAFSVNNILDNSVLPIRATTYGDCDVYRYCRPSHTGTLPLQIIIIV